MRPCSVFEEIVFCCFNKAPLGAIDFSRGFTPTVHGRSPIVLSPVGAIHLTSFRIHNRSSTTGSAYLFLAV